MPVNSIEENIYSSDKDGNELNILDTLKSNKDEANLITNKIVLNKIINSLEKRDKEIIGVSLSAIQCKATGRLHFR